MAKKISTLILVVFCLAIGFLVEFPIIGDWESSIIYHTFSPEEIWLNTLIHPRASIGGYEYAFLDLSRHVSSLFGFNLFSLRLLPIVYGFLSLYFFYLILTRWVSWPIALVTTGLLSVNPVFLTFQHQLTISIVSFAGLLFCILGFYIVEEDSVSRKSIIIFAVSCVISALNYQIGRYCMLAIVFYWLTKGIYFNRGLQLNKAWVIDPIKRINYGQFFIAFILLLTLLHPLNLLLFLNPEFLLPAKGDEISLGLAGISESIKFNFPLIFHSALGSSIFYGKYSTDIIVSVPYKLLNIPLLILFSIGVLGLFKEHDKRKNIFLLLLLLLTIVPITFSEVLYGNHTTLNLFREFFILIPCYIFIALGLKILKNYFQNKKLKNVVLLSGVFLVLLQTFENHSETERFNQYISSFKCQFNKKQFLRKFECELPENGDKTLLDKSFANTVLRKDEMRSYQNYLIPVWQYAQLLSQKLEEEKNNKKAIVIDAPVTDFINYGSVLSHTHNENVSQMYLALYLAENDINVNYISVYPGKGPYTSMQSIFGLIETRMFNLKEKGAKYVSTNLNMPLKLNIETDDYNFEKNNSTHYSRLKENYYLKENQNERKVRKFKYGMKVALLNNLGVFEDGSNSDVGHHFVMRSTNSKESNIYLVTTLSEKKYIINELISKEREYTTIKL